MRCWRGGTGCSRHRDTDRPTRRSPSLTFSSLFLTFHLCSLSLSRASPARLFLATPLPPPAIDSITCHLHVTHTCGQRQQRGEHPRLLFQRSGLTGGCSAWCHTHRWIRQRADICTWLKNISVWKLTRQLHVHRYCFEIGRTRLLTTRGRTPI